MKPQECGHLPGRATVRAHDIHGMCPVSARHSMHVSLPSLELGKKDWGCRDWVPPESSKGLRAGVGARQTLGQWARTLPLSRLSSTLDNSALSLSGEERKGLG